MLNSVIEVGRLVATPELKHSRKDKPIAYTRMRIAVDRDYKQDGKERVTDFFDVVCWRGVAEFVCKNFKKGQLILVKGILQTNLYTDTKNIKRKVTEIIAESVYFAEQKGKAADTQE